MITKVKQKIMAQDINKFHIVEVERMILGYFMTNGRKSAAMNKISELKDDYFFGDNELKTFKAIRKLYSSGSDVNLVSVKEEAKVKSTFLTECMKDICFNPDHSIKQLKKYADKRWMLARLNRTTELLEEKNPDILMSELSTELVGRVRETDSEKTGIKDLITTFEDYQSENYKSVEKGGLIGVPFGFECLDSVISGIRPGHYIVVKAGTSTGKSAFSLNLVSNVLKEGKKVLLFSLEMSQDQNIARILGIRTNFNALDIESGRHKDSELEIEEKTKLYDQKLKIIESKRSIDEILTAIRAEHVMEKVDLVVIDYIQNIALDGDRYESYTNASNKIQTLGKVLKVPIIVCSQVNKLGDARGSGDIDNHADFSIFLEKGEGDGIVELQVTKNRHGMLNGCKLKFKVGGELIVWPPL